jgi:aspartate racemase
MRAGFIAQHLRSLSPGYGGAMRLLGVLGGMSWTSTAEYYRLLNQGIATRLGGLHSARLLLHSVDFAPVAEMQHDGDWAGTAAVLVEAAQGLERAGAEGLLLATNTMHKVADEIEAAAGIPLLHIADATATRLVSDGRRSVGLLATAFTMEQTFYTDRLREHGLEVLIPNGTDRAEVHRIIYDELCLDVIRDDSRVRYQEVIARLAERGAEAIILGCTEITLLLDEGESPVPLYDTTGIHAEAAVNWMLGSAAA